jgi:hypothetical protein
MLNFFIGSFISLLQVYWGPTTISHTLLSVHTFAIGGLSPFSLSETFSGQPDFIAVSRQGEADPILAEPFSISLAAMVARWL